MERILRTRLVTSLVLLVVLGAGVSLGFALERARGAETGEQAAAEGSAEAPENRGRRPMYEQVGPTEEQKIRIDSIVADHRQAMKALHAEFRAAYNPRYQALVDETRAAIKRVLTPEQAVEYDSLVAAYERRRAERSSGEGRN